MAEVGRWEVMAPTLDGLATLGFEELCGVYRKARAPERVEGVLRGRMLATNPRARGSALWQAARWLSLSKWFPWRGKWFLADGSGANRVTPLDLRLFPFGSRPGESLFDGGPALLVDYDRPGNPWLIRRFRDEVRCVAPGLFLGQTYLVARQPMLTLYFGLEQARSGQTEDPRRSTTRSSLKPP